MELIIHESDTTEAKCAIQRESVKDCLNSKHTAVNYENVLPFHPFSMNPTFHTQIPTNLQLSPFLLHRILS